MMNFSKRLIICLVAILTFLNLQAGNEGTSLTLGNVKGRILDDTKQILPGAVIRIEGTNNGTTTDVNGYYTLSNLKEGTYTLSISYVGYKTTEIKVTVKAGKTVERDIQLDSGVELQDVVVTGAFEGQRRALQMQRSAMGVVNVVSADQVGKFPDSNIGDALKRINGVNVQYDQGEARFGQVRGTAAEFTSVTVDGNRIPSAEGDTRNVQLDLIPADMVQTIELNKVVTSDMDGDAIGGEINLVMKTTPSHRVQNFTVGSGYSWISKKPMWNLGYTYGDRFFNNKLGAMLAISYQYAPGGSDNAEYEYDVDDNSNVVLTKAEVRQYYVTRERKSYSIALDYKFNANNHISFKALYNRRNDWENRYRVTYKKLDSSAKKQSVVVQTKAGDNDEKNARLERQQTLDLSLHGEHQAGNLGINWGADFSRAVEDRPNERYFGLSYKTAFSDYFQDVGGRFPYSTKAVPTVNEDWSIDELTNSNRHIFENEWKFKLNFTLPIGHAAKYGKLKFGGKYAAKLKNRESHNYDYIDAYTEAFGNEWLSNLTQQIRKDFMAGDNAPVGTSFVSKQYLGSIDFNNLQGVEILEDAASNYRAHENIASGYLRYDLALTKQFNMVAGLRVENTHLKYKGYNWVTDEEENESLTATGFKSNSYTNLLPSLLLKYDFTPDWNLKASITKTLSRPSYSQLVPSVSYNIHDEEATIGNENLKPTTSWNFDLSTEYYFTHIGLVSAGIFYKALKNVIVNEEWKGETTEIPATVGNTYKITKPVNAYDGGIFGVELAYERDFGFITPALNCLGFYGTYTYTHSNTRNYHFEHRQVADGEEVKMKGTPEHTANASLYFKKYGFNIRLSYNFASSFLDEMGTEAALDRYYDHVHYLDLNASYTFGKQYKTTLFVDANNLLNQPLRYYQGTSDRTMQVEYYGVRLTAGIKINL